jgi:protein-disulfide isomerase
MLDAYNAMSFHVSGWGFVKWGMITLFALIIGWFGYYLIRYYRAIRSGDSNPLLDQRLEASLSSAMANQKVTEEDLLRLQPTSAPALGNPAAKLVIVEFLDFGCPYCRDSFPAVRELIQRYQDQIYFIARDFPVDSLHPRATAAALAARCAHEQGLYWPYHDKLFATQDQQQDEDLRRYAQEVGLNVPSFDQCYKEKRYQDRIQGEIADGLRAGVEGTPTFFFNGIRIQGALDGKTLEFLIKKFLAAHMSP